jgi:hypothetical protein
MFSSITLFKNDGISFNEIEREQASKLAACGITKKPRKPKKVPPPPVAATTQAVVTPSPTEEPEEDKDDSLITPSSSEAPSCGDPTLTEIKDTQDAQKDVHPEPQPVPPKDTKRKKPSAKSPGGTKVKERKTSARSGDPKVKSSFRLAARNCFLTFPAVSEERPLEDLRDKLVTAEQPKGLVYACIARELHKDGTPHFHFLLHYKLKRNITTPQYFNFLLDKQCNCSAVRDFSASSTYIKKGNDFCEWGISPLSAQKATVQKLVHSLESPNFQIQDIYEHLTSEDRLVVFEKSTKLEVYHRRYQGFLQLQALRLTPRLVDLRLDLLPSIPYYHPDHLPIWEALRDNLGPRAYKQKHIHIWSSLPDMGKSSLLNMLKSFAPTYIWPTDNWYEKYRNETFQFILWDEFTLIGQKTDFLKLLFAGEPMLLQVKGSHIHKTDNPLIISCANHSLRDLLLKKYSLKCECSIPPRSSDSQSLCKNEKSYSPNCTVTDFHHSLYKALCSRIDEVQVLHPLFPQDRKLHADAVKLYTPVFVCSTPAPSTAQNPAPSTAQNPAPSPSPDQNPDV